MCQIQVAHLTCTSIRRYVSFKNELVCLPVVVPVIVVEGGWIFFVIGLWLFIFLLRLSAETSLVCYYHHCCCSCWYMRSLPVAWWFVQGLPQVLQETQASWQLRIGINKTQKNKGTLFFQQRTETMIFFRFLMYFTSLYQYHKCIYFLGQPKQKMASEKGALFATLQWQSREAQDPKSFANHFRAVITWRLQLL